MELKSMPGSSSPAICAGSISSGAAEGDRAPLLTFHQAHQDRALSPAHRP